MQERLDYEIARFKRYKKNLCFALLDIDDFKSINDRYGHQTGDAVLRAVGAHAAGLLRTTDIIARYGGEEFALILPETPLDGAFLTLDRLRSEVANTTLATVPMTGAPIRITFSAGLAEAQVGEAKELVIGRADAALYTSKRSGKNMVTRAEKPTGG